MKDLEGWQFISELGLFSDKTMLLQQLQYVALHWAVHLKNQPHSASTSRSHHEILPAAVSSDGTKISVSPFFFLLRNIRTYYISLPGTNYIYQILFIMQGQIKHSLRTNILHKHKACVCLYTLMTCSHHKNSLKK